LPISAIATRTGDNAEPLTKDNVIPRFDNTTGTADCLGRILDRLDAQWQYDAEIEMPEAFEKYFYKTYRALNKTMLDYCTQSGQALRELSKYTKYPCLTKWLDGC